MNEGEISPKLIIYQRKDILGIPKMNENDREKKDLNPLQQQEHAKIY